MCIHKITFIFVLLIFFAIFLYCYEIVLICDCKLIPERIAIAKYFNYIFLRFMYFPWTHGFVEFII